MRTLLLNHACRPINVLSAKNAMKKLHSGKVDVIFEYDDVKIGNRPLPAVVRLRTPIILKKKFISVSSFSRLGVFIRDEGVCQYCSKQLDLDTYTIDHVLPKSRGGLLTWENAVASCTDCNRIKNNLTPQEAGMRLRKQPRSPGINISVSEKNRIKLKAILHKVDHESWSYFIDWIKNEHN